MGELALLFGVCLVAEGVAAVLPVAFPASVIAMLLLLALLLSGAVKKDHIGRSGRFLMGNMAFFFLPPCVGILEHWGTLAPFLVPFLAISVLTTPLVYAVTAWTVQLVRSAQRRGGDRHD